MPARGAIGQIPEAERTDHLCWVYVDDAAFDRALADFLSADSRVVTVHGARPLFRRM